MLPFTFHKETMFITYSILNECWVRVLLRIPRKALLHVSCRSIYFFVLACLYCRKNDYARADWADRAFSGATCTKLAGKA
jgi:hypothetical protein